MTTINEDFETVEIEMSHEENNKIVMQWLTKHLSDASMSIVAEELTEEALAQAILNESIIDIIRIQLGDEVDNDE